MHNQDNQTITGHRERTILSFRDRLIVYGGVFLIIAMAWAYMLYMGWAMDNMHLVDMWMPPNAGNHPWSAYDFFMLFIIKNFHFYNRKRKILNYSKLLKSFLLS